MIRRKRGWEPRWEIERHEKALLVAAAVLGAILGLLTANLAWVSGQLVRLT